MGRLSWAYKTESNRRLYGESAEEVLAHVGGRDVGEEPLSFVEGLLGVTYSFLGAFLCYLM